MSLWLKVLDPAVTWALQKLERKSFFGPAISERNEYPGPAKRGWFLAVSRGSARNGESLILFVMCRA